MVDAVKQIIFNRLIRASKLVLPLPYNVRIELEKESCQITELLLDEYKDHFDDRYQWLKRKIHSDRSIWGLQYKVVKGRGKKESHRGVSGVISNVPIFGRGE